MTLGDPELVAKLTELQTENHNLRRKLGWAEAEIRRLRDLSETREWIEVDIKGESMKKLAIELLKIVALGVLVGTGARAAEWVIPAPEMRVIVCRADDFDRVETCASAAKLLQEHKYRARNRIVNKGGMMLDLNLKTIGTITMNAKKIEADGAMCREVAALALIWAIGKMQNELSALIRKPGGTGNTSVD